MNRDSSFRNFKPTGHRPNCTCAQCSRMKLRESADAVKAWMQFENKRREDRAKRREERFRRKTERYDRNDRDS